MPFDQQTYVDQYQRENIVRVVVKLNKKTDADILAQLDAQDNRQGYIKSLIRKDINKGDLNMDKYWWIIDDATTAKANVFTERLNAKAAEQAAAAGRKAWERLTAREQESRDAFYIGLAPELEDGVPDLDKMTDIISFKD